jgi:Holliday junction DNA helicase RuvA
MPGADEGETDIIRDGYDALRTLGHSESDSRRLIDAALSKKKKYKDLNDLLRAVYEQQKE